MTEARLRAAGVEDPLAAPAYMAGAMRQDFIGAWLPFALFEISARLAASPQRPAETFRRWGLAHLADEVEEAQSAAALEAFGGS